MKRTSHTRRGLVIATGLLLLGLPACGGSTAEPQAPLSPVAAFDQQLHDRLPAGVRSRGEVRVATDAAYPPASGYAPDGRTIEGFEPDLAATLGRVLGVTFTFVRTDFADALPALQDGTVDLVMSAMTDTVERQAHVDFVDYFEAGSSIVVQRGNAHGISDLRDLCGQIVAVEEGSILVDLLERTQSSCKDDRIVVRQFSDNTKALVELRTGRAAAVLNDYPPAARLTTDARTSAHFQLASTTQYEPGFYGIAVPKDQPGLRDALHEAMNRVIRSGEYADVLDRWGVSSGAVSAATVNGGIHG
jgi:polar amino acid transport system substrate-binding protein